MIDWLITALKQLTLDEFELCAAKVQDVYRSSFKIVSVYRPENNRPRITVQLENGQQKLVVL